MKISENPKCQLRSCRDSKKESVKNPGNSGFFHRPFSVLYFLIVSSFVCAFLVPCGGRVLISVQQQQQCQQQRFNALCRASPISTARKERGISHEHAVSMPYIRLLPFLQMAETKTSIRQIVCQCPTSGFSHFYDAEEAKEQPTYSVSMPYIGLLPFLQNIKSVHDDMMTVSMPYIGLLPFLPAPKISI